MKKELLTGLSKEQLEKASRCKDTKELLALAKDEGVELNEEQLKAVNGGLCQDKGPVIEACPDCGQQVEGEYIETTPGDGKYHFRCLNCGHHWTKK